jgi:hypothetical protein
VAALAATIRISLSSLAGAARGSEVPPRRRPRRPAADGGRSRSPPTWTRWCGSGPARHHPRAASRLARALRMASGSPARRPGFPPTRPRLRAADSPALGASAIRARWTWATTPSICSENVPCGAAASIGSHRLRERLSRSALGRKVRIRCGGQPGYAAVTDADGCAIGHLAQPGGLVWPPVPGLGVSASARRG